LYWTQEKTITTIAIDPAAGVMVADTNVSDGSQKWRANKVEQIGGVFYGAAGDAADIEKFYEWLREWARGPRKPRKTKLSDEDFAALSLDTTGAYFWDEHLHPMRITDKFAIGTGSHAARGAMDAGADVVRAVEIACGIDVGSGMPLTVHRINEETK
jgi:hypothetical protein